MLVIGAGAAILEANNHSTCESGVGQLAQAFSQSLIQQCALDNTIFYGGVVVGVVGAVMLLVAAILAVARASSR